MAINFEDIIARMRAEQQRANQANEERYQALLETIRGLGNQTQGTYQDALDRVEGIGETARTRVEQGATRATARADQDLTSRGLGNTTIRESVFRGIQDDAALQQQGIDESVAQQQSGILQNRAGAEMQVGGMLANAMQSRNDIGPNLSLYSQLLQQAAAQSDERVNVAVGRGLPPGGPSVSASSGSSGGSGFGSRVANKGGPATYGGVMQTFSGGGGEGGAAPSYRNSLGNVVLPQDQSAPAQSGGEQPEVGPTPDPAVAQGREELPGFKDGKVWKRFGALKQMITGKTGGYVSA